VAWIRLKDSNGRIVQLINARPDTQFGSARAFGLAPDGGSDIVLLPTADGARALLVASESGGLGLPFSDYRLTWEFRRDVGPEAAVLREAGRSETETVSLLFTLP
jgi:hypothetical protein